MTKAAPATAAAAADATKDLDMTKEELAGYIDSTLLKADATHEDLKNLCDEAKQYHVASVCVNSVNAYFVSRQLRDTDIKTCCVVGFPLGAMASAAKSFEAACAIEDGAQEIDMVIDVAAAKTGNWRKVREDIEDVLDACDNRAILKVIIECCLLTDEQKVKACQEAKNAGAQFVKTSTGFSTGGATLEDVKLMRETVGPDMGVKAAGGIHDGKTAAAMICAGATRIGASKTAEILESL